MPFLFGGYFDWLFYFVFIYSDKICFFLFLDYGIDLPGLSTTVLILQVDYFNNKRKSRLLQRHAYSNVTGFRGSSQPVCEEIGEDDASLTLNQKIGQVILVHIKFYVCRS